LYGRTELWFSKYEHYFFKIKDMKTLLSLLFFSCICLSCNNQVATKTDAVENEKLIKQYFSYFNKHEWEKMANMYTETAEFKDPSLGKNIVTQTRQQTIEKYTALNNTFPNIKDSIVQMYSSGNNNVIVEFISKGTAPDNTMFEIPICTIFTIVNGKITKDFTYYDNFGEEGNK